MGLGSLAMALAALSASTPELRVAIPPPGPESWQPLGFHGVERQTVYEPLTPPAPAGVRARSRCSASGLVFRVGDLDLARTPHLRWRWRVVTPLEIAHERSRAGDDFAGRVYVLFPLDPERASWLARLRHRLAERLAGEAMPGAALNYVSSSHEVAGARWDNPYEAASKMISLGPAPVGRWQALEVDVRADYRAAFGSEPPPPMGLGLMTDSDNSCGEAETEFADFAFVAAANSPNAAPGSR